MSYLPPLLGLLDNTGHDHNIYIGLLLIYPLLNKNTEKKQELFNIIHVMIIENGLSAFKFPRCNNLLYEIQGGSLICLSLSFGIAVCIRQSCILPVVCNNNTVLLSSHKDLKY